MLCYHLDYHTVFHPAFAQATAPSRRLGNRQPRERTRIALRLGASSQVLGRVTLAAPIGASWPNWAAQHPGGLQPGPPSELSVYLLALT